MVTPTSTWYCRFGNFRGNFSRIAFSFVMANCGVVTFPFVSWVRCGAWLYRFLIFALFSYFKRHICHVKKLATLACFTYISKGLRVSAISRGFYFRETPLLRSFVKIKPSRKLPNLQYSLERTTVSQSPKALSMTPRKCIYILWDSKLQPARTNLLQNAGKFMHCEKTHLYSLCINQFSTNFSFS